MRNGTQDEDTEGLAPVVAGALHAHSARLVWVEHKKKFTTLFMKLLAALRRMYRRGRSILLILDTYIV